MGHGLAGCSGCRDEELKLLAAECHSEIDLQSKWFLTRIKTGAPQALVVG